MEMVSNTQQFSLSVSESKCEALLEHEIVFVQVNKLCLSMGIIRKSYFFSINYNRKKKWYR